MRVLITGGYGFVGSSLFFNLKRSKRLSIFRFKSKEFDLRKSLDTKKLINKYKPDLIINCAGKVGGILENYNKNLEFLNHNFIVNYNLINISKDLKIPKFLNLSSSCIYAYKKGKIKEEDFLNGPFEKTNEGYAFGKAFAQKLTSLHDDPKNGFYYKTLIPCNLFGENDNFNEHSSHLIPAIINKINEAKKNNYNNITIFGDGTPKREFMYIKNLENIIFQIIKKNLFQKLPCFLNIGMGKDLTVYQYHKIISNIMKYKVKFIYDLSKPNGIKRKLLDTSQMKKLGFKTPYSLDYGLKKTINFYKKYVR